MSLNNPYPESPAGQRATAREHLRRGDLGRAEQSYARLLGVAPDDIEARQFLAGRHYSRGEHAQAIELLLVADKFKKNDPSILCQLGAAQLGTGDFSAASTNLQRGLQLAPEMFVARLQLGIALEQLGHVHDALVAYFVAKK